MKNRILKLQVISSAILFFFPLILLWSNDWIMRKSISNYAYADNNAVFYTLLTLSCLPFLIDGVVHYKKYYNIILGLSLVGVSLTPHLDYPLWHYTFTAIFFVYGAFVIIYYSSKEQRKWKIALGLTMALTLISAFFWHFMKVFIAEWIGIAIYAFHYIGEALGKID